MKKPLYTFEIFASGASHYWRIRHRNGEILCVSEAYTTQRKCRRTPTNIIKAIEATSGKQSKNWTVETV